MSITVLSTGVIQRLSEMEAGQTIQAGAFMQQSFCNDWRRKLVLSIGNFGCFRSRIIDCGQAHRVRRIP